MARRSRSLVVDLVGIPDLHCTASACGVTGSRGKIDTRRWLHLMMRLEVCYRIPGFSFLPPLSFVPSPPSSRISVGVFQLDPLASRGTHSVLLSPVCPKFLRGGGEAGDLYTIGCNIRIGIAIRGTEWRCQRIGFYYPRGWRRGMYG